MTFKKTNVLNRFITLDYQRPVKININKMTTENNYKIDNQSIIKIKCILYKIL